MRPDLRSVALVMTNLFGVYLAVGGIAMMVSTLSNRRGRAIAVVFGLVLASFLLNFVAQYWAPAKPFAFLSVMNYYQPARVLESGTFPVARYGGIAECRRRGVAVGRRDHGASQHLYRVVRVTTLLDELTVNVTSDSFTHCHLPVTVIVVPSHHAPARRNEGATVYRAALLLNFRPHAGVPAGAAAWGNGQESLQASLSHPTIAYWQARCAASAQLHRRDPDGSHVS